MRLVIAADTLLARAGLARLLEEFEIAAEASDAGELLRKARAHRPDVAVVDLGTPPVAALRALGAGVVAISARVDPELGAAGVGYLLRDRLERLPDAIREVARGGSVLDP